MNDERSIPERGDELRALFGELVLGMSDPDDRERLDEQLSESDVRRSEFERMAGALAELYEIGPRRKPPASLWGRVLDQVRADGAKPEPESVAEPPPESAAPISLLVRSGDVDWQPSGVPGVRRKPLHGNEETGERVVLVEMAPGATIPAHDHLGTEHCYVLRGDLQVAGRLLVAGDYHRMAAGSRHQPITSPSGCLALVIEAA
ncbi:MAG: cupin domain-containing protein [Planctomycetota bacterium]